MAKKSKQGGTVRRREISNRVPFWSGEGPIRRMCQGQINGWVAVEGRHKKLTCSGDISEEALVRTGPVPGNFMVEGKSLEGRGAKERTPRGSVPPNKPG